MLNSQELDQEQIKKDIRTLIQKFKESHGFAQNDLTIECATDYSESEEWHPDPSWYPSSLVECKEGVQNLEKLPHYAPEVFLRDTIKIGKVDYWTKFPKTQFKYVLDYRFTDKTKKFLYETIKPLKTEFFTKGYQMLENLSLPRDTLFDCAYAGRIDWCLEALTLMQDIVLDLSEHPIHLISMTTFEMYCFKRDGVLHLHIPNTYDRETIVKNLHRCFLDDDSIHHEDLMSKEPKR